MQPADMGEFFRGLFHSRSIIWAGILPYLGDLFRSVREFQKEALSL
jgi:hypothetical protein